MKKIILLIALLSFANAGIVDNWIKSSIDEYGRSLKNHEQDGGHTISRHVKKTLSYLRARCNGRKSNNFYSSYRFSRDAENTLYAMINLNKRNRIQINNFQRNRGYGVRRKIRGNMKGVPWLGYWGSGKGKGIDCSHLNEVKKYRLWHSIYYHVKLDEYNYLRHATAVLNFNHTKGRWYIQTSSPSK